MSDTELKAPRAAAGEDRGPAPFTDDTGGLRAPSALDAAHRRRLIVGGLAVGVPAACLLLWVGLRSMLDGPAPTMTVGGHAQSLEGLRGKTTESILRAQGLDCLECAERSGCLDPRQEGGRCEDTTGTATACGAGISEADMCLKTLTDIFSSRCAAVLQETPCLCGTTDTQACLEATAPPTGPILPDYTCDFNTTKTPEILASFRTQTFGAGQANALVQCVAQSDCKCFGASGTSAVTAR